MVHFHLEEAVQLVGRPSPRMTVRCSAWSPRFARVLIYSAEDVLIQFGCICLDPLYSQVFVRSNSNHQILSLLVTQFCVDVRFISAVASGQRIGLARASAGQPLLSVFPTTFQHLIHFTEKSTVLLICGRIGRSLSPIFHHCWKLSVLCM